MKGSVQQTSVIRPEVSEHGPVFPGPGAGLMTGTRYQDPVLPAPPGKPGTMTTPGAPGLPVIPGDSVTPGDSVRPVFTGQEAQKEKIDKSLERSELPVLNSPGSSVQLEHNVHMQQRNMPNLLVEHVSVYTEVGQDFTYSDSSNVKAYESSNRTQLPHFPPGIGHTGNPLGIGHTGNRSDQEHGSVRTRHHSDVSRSSRRDSNTRRNTIPLQHADPGEHSPASMIRHRPARSRSRSYDSVSSRRRSRSTSRSRGKKNLPLLVLLHAVLPLHHRVKAKEKEKGTNLKIRRNTLNTLNHIPSVIRVRVRRSTRGRGVPLHLLPRCLLLFLRILLLLLGEVQPRRNLD